MIKRNLSLRTKFILLGLFSLVFAASSHKAHAVDADVVNTNQAAGTRPDNSKINVRDRNNANVLPGDQKGNKQDLDVTTRVRRSLVNHTNNLSTAARNIKVVTVNGKVTLRGPVKTEEEKSKIDAMAKQVAGEANVDDQLEVKNSQ
jgi:hyperosmotically inducible periplasmic protein